MLLSVIIPAYNEEKTIARIADLARRVAVPKEIIIVDDGSSDRTPAILASLKTGERTDEMFAGFTVIRQKNTGKGSAIRTGIAAARGDIILFQDADLEYDPRDYPALVGPILEKKAAAVMGSRIAGKKNNFWVGGRPTLRYLRNHLGIRVITFLTNMLYGQRATDYEGCYKAFRADILKNLPLAARGFEIDNEIICKMLRRGHRVLEVPIRYYPRSYEEGKKIKVRDGFKILWTIAKWRILTF